MSDSSGPDVAPPQPDPVELPIDGVLDLHTFHPSDVRTLVPEYLALCRDRGILEVRIIHGKGDGTMRRTVHALLERDPGVLRYGLAGPEAGGWGATLATLANTGDLTPSR